MYERGLHGHRPRRRRYGRESDREGFERAMRHIEEARELTRELGGTDADVKAYFYSLPTDRLRPILDEYERRYGGERRVYAEETLPAWRSGRVKMSGEVAGRLFGLLPRYMPPEARYALVEKLWERYRPRSQHSVVFGPEQTAEQVMEIVRGHLRSVVRGHEVPEPLKRRFLWLAEGDAAAYERLLNHFLERDLGEAVRAVEGQAAVIMPHAASGAMQAFRREVRVGGHEVSLVMEPGAEGVRVVAGAYVPPRAKSDDYGWVGLAAAMAFIVVLLLWAIGRS